MSSVRPPAPSPPPGGLPGPPPPRRRRSRAAPPPAAGAAPGSGSGGGAGTGSNDVFVTSRSDFRAQLRRCQRLLAPGAAPGATPGSGTGAGTAELRLHGLGLAVPRTINLALQLQAGAGGTLRISASTSSVPLRPPPHRDHRRGHRDHRDGDQDGDDGDAPRHNSAIHIRLCREAPCA